MAATKTIHLKGGPIIASVEDDGLIVAQSIHFSHQQRFEPPRPVDPWTEPIDCTKPGPVCPQSKFRYPPLGEVVDLGRPQDEDCVLVNVVAPSDAKDLPVAVWFTGGAYISGFADLKMYDTRPLVRRGLVTVNVQYRLGIFGYATIPGIAPPNLGLQDQILGLKWVQENIAIFGGDPSRVTIYGQSAGGDSVYGMLLADGTDGLFHQAVLMSAPWGIFVTERPDSDVLLKTIAEKTKGEDIRTLPVSRLLEIQESVIHRRAKAGLVEPGFLLTHGAAPLPALADTKARLAERASKIPVLVGWTKDDALPFVMMRPQSAIWPSIPLIGTSILHGIGRVATYFIFARGAQQFHAQYKQLGGRSSTYVIEYYPDNATYLAAHCMELTLLFGDYDWWTQTPLLGPADRKAYERLADTFKTFFVDFVKGHPLAADHYRVHKDFVHKSGAAKL